MWVACHNPNRRTDASHCAHLGRPRAPAWHTPPCTRTPPPRCSQSSGAARPGRRAGCCTAAARRRRRSWRGRVSGWRAAQTPAAQTRRSCAHGGGGRGGRRLSSQGSQLGHALGRTRSDTGCMHRTHMPVQPPAAHLREVSPAGSSRVASHLRTQRYAPWYAGAPPAAANSDLRTILTMVGCRLEEVSCSGVRPAAGGGGQAGRRMAATTNEHSARGRCRETSGKRTRRKGSVPQSPPKKTGWAMGLAPGGAHLEVVAAGGGVGHRAALPARPHACMPGQGSGPPACSAVCSRGQASRRQSRHVDTLRAA